MHVWPHVTGERKPYLDLVNLIGDYFVCSDYASEPVDETHAHARQVLVHIQSQQQEARGKKHNVTGCRKPKEQKNARGIIKLSNYIPTHSTHNRNDS